jgi:hypothetical protein
MAMSRARSPTVTATRVLPRMTSTTGHELAPRRIQTSAALVHGDKDAPRCPDRARSLPRGCNRPAGAVETAAMDERERRPYRGVIPADRWHEPYMQVREIDEVIAAGVSFWGYESKRIPWSA